MIKIKIIGALLLYTRAYCHFGLGVRMTDKRKKCFSNSDSSITWNQDLINRYDLAGPRYTSYPTAPQFNRDFTEGSVSDAIEQSNAAGSPLSLYFHIPFCDTVCYYCACNKIVTANKERAQPYLDRLHKEIALKARQFNKHRIVKQLHWGGGTPTFISHIQMRELMENTRRNFKLLDDDSGEYSIEIHPGNIEDGTLPLLRQLGFNRLSMGVQDFNLQTQQALNRFNSFDDVTFLVDQARQEKFHSLSMDLIYGLPYQSKETLAQTLEKIIVLSPDRISLFNYAHLPHLFKTQKQIDEKTLPSAGEKLNMLQYAIETLCTNGYVFIGMDHFAKPNDDLTLVQAKGELKRNFQGYSTHGDCDLLAFGVSAISAIGNIYVQNHKLIEDYHAALDNNTQPIQSGISLNQDDHIRQEVINQLICHFVLRFEQIEKLFNIEFKDYFKAELTALEPLAKDELLEISSTGIEVQPQGRLLVRRICMLFDAYLTQQPEIRYSQII